MIRGSLADTSIFADEGGKVGEAEEKQIPRIVEPRNPHTMAAALDPDPAGRRRWERKMVIREITKRGRLSKKQLLKQQERILISKSHNWGTSVKKLLPLAKQISGKTIEEAIIQMRFSKKKSAKVVKAHLEHAKNEAIVKRGMGLGLKKGETFKPMTIMTNDGKRVKVTDPTTIYVEQAWCGAARYGTTPDHRARGNIYIMKNRTSHIAVVLREEKTRIRLHEERLKKEQNKKVWVQLPNRPITAQRQYYSW
jgi:ribosomal protein L22